MAGGVGRSCRLRTIHHRLENGTRSATVANTSAGTGAPMPTNIEIKSRLADLPRARGVVAAISDTPPQTLRQRDTFFRCTTGRLKLREFGTGQAELIFYSRSDVAGAKQSDYEVIAVADSEALRVVLSRSLGVTQIVEKTRVLYLVGQTRVHLDSVDRLGDFLELEVVLRPGQDSAEGQAIAADLMQRLGIRATDLCSTAYADMLTESAAGIATTPSPRGATPSDAGRGPSTGPPDGPMSSPSCTLALLPRHACRRARRDPKDP